MSRINDLLDQLDVKHRECISADALVERMFAEGFLEESHIDALAQKIDEYQELLEQATRELDVLDDKLRNWK